MTIHFNRCRRSNMPQGMWRTPLVAALVLAAAAGCSATHATSEGPHESGSAPLELDLTRRLMHLDDVRVLRVEETRSERCDSAAVGGDEVGCHRILEAGSAPMVGWSRIM
ncbi:MAG TPA: hypothetical protein VFV24_10055, partial [Candidatus Eisenbacteria bacterium]|nr:hypothetical protein [Candidatus Eisenbacteria bacterium]